MFGNDASSRFRPQKKAKASCGASRRTCAHVQPHAIAKWRTERNALHQCQYCAQVRPQISRTTVMKRHRFRDAVSLQWCSRRDSNPYGLPSEPKSDASANFATTAPHYYITRRRYVKHLPFPTNFCKFPCENSCILPRCLVYYNSLAGVTQW